MAIYKEAKRPEISQHGDKYYGVVKEYMEVLKSIKKDSRYDPITNTNIALCEGSVQNELLNYYKKDLIDYKSAEYDAERGGNPNKLKELEEEVNLYFENDRQCMCEASPLHGYNPTMTFTPPLHKDILMNCVWHQGVIPRLVTNTPNIQIEREILLLTDPSTGEKFNMFEEQYKISQAMKNARPVRRIACGFPEDRDTNFLMNLFGVNNSAIKANNPNGIKEHLDTNAHISGIIADVMVVPGEQYTCLDPDCAATYGFDEKYSYVKVAETDGISIGEAIKKVNAEAGFTALMAEQNFITKTAGAAGVIENAVIPVRLITYPIIGQSDRTGFNHEFKLDVAVNDGSGNWSSKSVNVLVSGIMRDDRLKLMTNSADVKGFIFTCQQAASTGSLQSPTGEWVRKTHMERIPEATHIQAQVSPEEMKDVAVLYNVNQITKHMGFFAKMLENYRDDTTKEFLDDSFERMPWRNQMSHIFNFVPEYQYVENHLTWAKEAFLPDLDTWVTQMLNIYNDGNVIVNIVGRSDIIRKLTPTTYTWSTPSQVGPFQLDFVKTVQTSDNRTYQFISSDKMRDDNNLIIILTPKNSERFMYRIYDYQTYVSNELNGVENIYLPAITAFDRWGIYEFMPIQARVQCINVMGHTKANYDDNFAQVGGYESFVPRTRGLNDWSVINPSGGSSH